MNWQKTLGAKVYGKVREGITAFLRDLEEKSGIKAGAPERGVVGWLFKHGRMKAKVGK